MPLAQGTKEVQLNKSKNQKRGLKWLRPSACYYVLLSEIDYFINLSSEKKYVLSNRNLDPRLSVSFAYKEGREERPVIEADPIVFYLILSYVIPGHHRQ